MVEQVTRRERYRQQTIDEIKALAMEQVTDGGVATVSLNAIARTMAMSPGALYRYFDNRDELLAELAVAAYDSLADTLERALPAGGTKSARLTAVAKAYREWAVQQPNTYRLIFESPTGSGEEFAAGPIAAASQRSMDVFLRVLSEFEPPADDGLTPALEQQIAAWATRSGNSRLPIGTLRLGLTWWGRLHGLVSLALGGHLRATGVDPQLIYESEIQALLQHLNRGE
jgi:AcrR family transcriptional regulator